CSCAKNTRFKIRIFDVHNSSSSGWVCKARSGLREKSRSIDRVNGKLAVTAASRFDARSRSRGNAHNKIATAHNRKKIRKILRSHGSGRYLTSARAEERSINPESQFGNLAG